MSIVLLIALCRSSEGTRKFAFFSWIFFIVLVLHIYYLVIVVNGTLLDYLCHEETVMKVNELGISEPITVQECELGGKTYVLTDSIVGWLIDLYFASVIMRWSKNEEAW